jgi:integrase/recombinase XerD
MHLVKPKRSRFYQLVYLKNGKRTSISTKATSKNKALRFLVDFNERLRTKKSFQQTTLKNFKKEYEKLIEETRTRSYLKSVKLSFNQLIDFTGDINLNELDTKLAETFIQTTFKRANYSAGLYYRTLKAALSTALRWNYIDSNPFQLIKQPKQLTKFPLFISYQELESIQQNISKIDINNMITISFDAGLRLGEVVNLRWTDINLQQKILLVSNYKDFQTKNKKDRIIPLTEKLYNKLLEIAPDVFSIRNNSNYVFESKNKIRYNQDYVSRSFKKAVRELKLNEDYTYHTLRHSFASQLVQRGVSLYVVKELMGHQDIRTTQIYSHLEPKNLFEAVDKLNKQII